MSARRTTAVGRTDTIVNTGILPVSFRAVGGRAIRVNSTGLGHVAGSLGASGSLTLHEAVSLPLWGWIVVASVVVSPLAGFIWHALRDDEGMSFEAPSQEVPVVGRP